MILIHDFDDPSPATPLSGVTGPQDPNCGSLGHRWHGQVWVNVFQKGCGKLPNEKPWEIPLRTYDFWID